MGVLALIVLVPLAGAALLALTSPLERRHAADALAVACALAVGVLSAIALHRATTHVDVQWAGGWRPRGEIALGIDLYADPLAAGLIAFASALTVTALVVSWRREDTSAHLLQALGLLFLAGMAGFSLAGDLFTMFVFFELFSVASYALTGLLADRRSPVEGALNLAVSNTLGSVILLTGIALLYGRTGALNLAQIGASLHGADAAVALAFALIAAGFLVKAAIVPFHFWLADAYTAAPVGVCVLFAGVMSELGIYGLARVYWTAFASPLAGEHALLRDVLLALAALTAVTGAVMCVPQRLLKRRLAFVTVAHMGVMLFGVALLAPAGITGLAIYVVGDGMVKAGLFVAAGILATREGTGDLGRLHGRGRGAPVLGAVALVGGLAVAGLPPLGPFLGRALIEDGAVAAGLWWVPWLLAAVAAVTGGAVLRGVAGVHLGLGRRPAGEPLEAGDELEPERATASLWVPAVALTLLGVLWGLVPGLTGAVAGAALAFTRPLAYADVVLRASGGAAPSAVVPSPSAATYWLGLGATAAAIAFALVPRLPRAPALVVRLRELQSGHATDYLAWIATGVAALALAGVLGMG